MKKESTISAFIFSIFLLIVCFFSSSLYAKTINLYDQPKNDAKVLGTLDLSVGIIPIFTPKEGGWIKVGDPRNGQVGWIKSSDMNNAGRSFSFTQHFIDNGKSIPQNYQIIQFGTPPNLTPDQVKKLQQEQQQIQQATQKAMQNMIKDMQSIYQNATKGLNNMPVIMPIVIMPSQKVMPSKPASTAPDSAAKPAPSSPK